MDLQQDKIYIAEDKYGDFYVFRYLDATEAEDDPGYIYHHIKLIYSDAWQFSAFGDTQTLDNEVNEWDIQPIDKIRDDQSHGVINALFIRDHKR